MSSLIVKEGTIKKIEEIAVTSKGTPILKLLFKEEEGYPYYVQFQNEKVNLAKEFLKGDSVKISYVARGGSRSQITNLIIMNIEKIN